MPYLGPVGGLARGFVAPLFDQQILAVPLLLLIVQLRREGQSRPKSNDLGYCGNGRIGPSFCLYYGEASGQESYSNCPLGKRALSCKLTQRIH